MTFVPTIRDIQIQLCVMVPFACLVTYFRLYIRGTRGKLWWDDFWAFMSSICAIIFVVSIMLHVDDPTKYPQNVKISIYYMCAQFFYAVNWTARISILFTVIRLATGRLRKVLIAIAVMFFTAWAVLFAQVWWVCEAKDFETIWKPVIVPQCPLGKNVAIAQVVADVLSDTILIIAPVSLLSKARLTEGLKIRLMAVFAATSLTTAVSLWHASAILTVGGLMEIVAAIAQTSISLLVTNLGVVVAFFFNLGHDEGTTARGSGNTGGSGFSSSRTFGKGNNRTGTKGLTSTAYTVDTTTTVHVDMPAGEGKWSNQDTLNKSFVDTDYEMDHYGKPGKV